LSLTPGAVIDLDRTAGAPVDVLVNGTPIARGEVVVIDEQFGIRVSEILTNPATS
jgi:flagellar motor switch protein FliN/FliY